MNDKYTELEGHTTVIAQQINKNLAYLENLEQLKIIHMGEKGVSFVENIYKMLPQSQLCWQLYGAVIIWGAHRPWVYNLLLNKKF